MYLKELGFPYKRYEREKLDTILRQIQGRYLDFDILEGNDHYFVAEKLKEAGSDKYALKKKGLSKFTTRRKRKQAAVQLSDDQIDWVNHDLCIEQGIHGDDSTSFFAYIESIHYDFQQSCLEQPTEMQEVQQNEVDMITNQLIGSLSLHRSIPMSPTNYTILRDTLGSSVSSPIAAEYLQKHPDQFQHRNHITLSLKAQNQISVDTLFAPMIESEFVREAKDYEDTSDTDYVSSQLAQYQRLRELLVSEDFKKMSTHILKTGENLEDMSLQVNYIKRKLPRFPYSDQALFSSFSAIQNDGTIEHHRSHILVPKGIAVPDIVAKGALGIKNFDVVEQGRNIQHNVYQKLHIKK